MSIKDLRLPKFFISNVTGTTIVAVPITKVAIGNVDIFSIGANRMPMRPPTNTTTEFTDVTNACAIVSNQTFLGRFFIDMKIENTEGTKL